MKKFKKTQAIIISLEQTDLGPIIEGLTKLISGDKYNVGKSERAVKRPRPSDLLRRSSVDA